MWHTVPTSSGVGAKFKVVSSMLPVMYCTRLSKWFGAVSSVDATEFSRLVKRRIDLDLEEGDLYFSEVTQRWRYHKTEFNWD